VVQMRSENVWKDDSCSASIAPSVDQTEEEERGYLSDSPTYHSGNLDPTYGTLSTSEPYWIMEYYQFFRPQHS
jgi:hypothetical protein